MAGLGVGGWAAYSDPEAKCMSAVWDGYIFCDNSLPVWAI